MKIDGKSVPTVLILGAGATRGAFPHVLVNRKRIKAPLNFDFFKVAETYSKARGRRSAPVRRLNRLKTIFKNELPTKWPPPMETAFSLLYTAKDFPEIYASGPGRRPAAGASRELGDFLSVLFDILSVLDERVDDSGYDRLAGTLEAGDTVITLNYDTVLDSALVRQGWNPQTGYALEGGKKKVKWRPVAQTVPGPTGVRLLKLHGSMNWWVRGSLSTLSDVFAKKPALITRPRRNAPAGKIRQIIPPIYGKVFGHSHWRRLWKSAFAALCSADCLVVVGCSIVETDYHLQALLRRVVKVRKKRRSKLRSVILVDRVKTRRKWKSLLRGAINPPISYRTFEAFLTGGLRV